MTLSSKQHVRKDHLSLKGVRVLVVEDTWHVAKALESALAELGMDVSGPAATTAEAKRLVAEHMPSVAVVDVNLKREMACDLIEELHVAFGGLGHTRSIISFALSPPLRALEQS